MQRMMKPMSCRPAKAGFSLVEILIVVAMIAILAGGIYSVYLGKSGKKGEKSHGPIAEAQLTVCTENLRQIRMWIDMTKNGDPDGKFPELLAELKFPQELLICPDGKEPYQYDPTTGQVTASIQVTKISKN